MDVREQCALGYHLPREDGYSHSSSYSLDAKCPPRSTLQTLVFRIALLGGSKIFTMRS